MKFAKWVESSKINPSWGKATPLSVGDEFYSSHVYPTYPDISPRTRISGPAFQANLRDNSPVNISYIIDINIRSGVFGHYESLKLSAEGIYDAETRQLCLVGCRDIPEIQSSINDSKDCQIVITFQFPPSKPEMNEGYIKGSIKCTRVKSDPFYFETIDVSSVITIRRMDLEITIAVITNTLECVFVE